MLLRQEFASSSFYYSISHEFFSAQAPDPANTYAWAKQHSADGAYCIQSDWVFAAWQTPGTCGVYWDFQLFGGMGPPAYDS